MELLTLTSSIYFKDKRNIHFRDKIVTGAKVNTFTIMRDNTNIAF